MEISGSIFLNTEELIDQLVKSDDNNGIEKEYDISQSKKKELSNKNDVCKCYIVEHKDKSKPKAFVKIYDIRQLKFDKCGLEAEIRHTIKHIITEKKIAKKNFQDIKTLKFYGQHTYENGDELKIYFFFQYFEEGDLKKRLDKKGPFIEAEVKDILQQVAFFLLRILEEDYIHGDIKPDNILINEGKVIVADFGQSARLKSSEFHEGMGRTPGYEPPEYQNIGSIDADGRKKYDIWCLGVTAFELLYGEMPQRDHNDNIILPLTFLETPAVSDSMKAIISGMIEKDLKERFSPQQLLDRLIGDQKYIARINLIKEKIRKQLDLGNKICSVTTLLSKLSAKHDEKFLQYTKVLNIFLYSEVIRILDIVEQDNDSLLDGDKYQRLGIMKNEAFNIIKESKEKLQSIPINKLSKDSFCAVFFSSKILEPNKVVNGDKEKEGRAFRTTLCECIRILKENYKASKDPDYKKLIEDLVSISTGKFPLDIIEWMNDASIDTVNQAYYEIFNNREYSKY